MIVTLEYLAFFVLLLTALLLAIKQMSVALDELDIERFTLWTGIASVIAGIPSILW
ncbi:hypothetical protein H6G93_23560 [Nostoc sp. FACHB-973]|uniref:Uncharacterized protein n=1 Tax=Desmonostoc muscorum LEGE 12446 TaxID=1828758 RepID=A0A8J6ZXM0_DESMC|nr:hypothetical protein [Desmonostoc muscorum]MBD2517902.1 hypothetical protein [Nostoc sp. FACHB-973]MBX9253653.1 hypothetical protein [Desmonostoc muscorum CCALA 125]MCF2150583.1 hypothetical protein [Desmonostoc muscorum LEGE 12446]